MTQPHPNAEVAAEVAAEAAGEDPIVATLRQMLVTTAPSRGSSEQLGELLAAFGLTWADLGDPAELVADYLTHRWAVIRAASGAVRRVRQEQGHIQAAAMVFPLVDDILTARFGTWRMVFARGGGVVHREPGQSTFVSAGHITEPDNIGLLGSDLLELLQGTGTALWEAPAFVRTLLDSDDPEQRVSHHDIAIALLDWLWETVHAEHRATAVSFAFRYGLEVQIAALLHAGLLPWSDRGDLQPVIHAALAALHRDHGPATVWWLDEDLQSTAEAQVARSYARWASSRGLDLADLRRRKLGPDDIARRVRFLMKRAQILWRERL